MRISTGYQFDSYSKQVSINQSRLYEAERMVATGKRIHQVGDDPSGTRSLLSLRSLKAGVDQYSANLQHAKGFLGFAEQSMADVSDLLKQAYTFALSGANFSTSQAGRAAMASEVGDLQRQLVNLANTQGPSGEYIYAGQAFDQKPFTVSGATLTYSGDSGSINAEVGPNETLAVNSQMGATFVNVYQKLEDLKTFLTGGDTASLSGVSIADMQQAMKDIDSERGQVGTRLQAVEQRTEHFARRAEEFTSGISDVEEIDMTEAIVKYQQAQTAYQAAMQMAAKGFGLSLMDFIRG
jgi:flagellar hook-associated protein 3 FlgL